MALVEGARNPKRMRLQHSFEGKNKACLILHCLDPQPLSEPSMSHVTYNIFIVDDLNADTVVDDGFARVSPTLQIDCGTYQIPITAAFCVLGGTLYMFEGCVSGSGGKSVFAIDLALTRALTKEARKLEKGGALLKKIGEVSSPKAVPVALPTPDGEKIIVFSTENFAPGSGFEIFEPVNGSCKQLPSIPGFWNSINLYGFIDKSQRLLVQTQTAAIYVMDLASPDKHWEKLDASAFYSGLKHIPPYHFESSFFEAVLGRRFCCVNLFGFYDLESQVAEGNPRNPVGYRFTSPVSFGLGLPRGCSANSCVSLLNYDEDGKDFLFCHLAMEKPSEGYAESCRLAISVCRVDLEAYKKETDELKSEGWPWTSSYVKRNVTALVKVHTFTLAFYESYYVAPPHLFFTF